MEKPCTSRNPPCKVFRPEKPCRKSYPTASFFSFLNLGTALLWSLLRHRSFFRLFEFSNRYEFFFGNGKDALQHKTICENGAETFRTLRTGSPGMFGKEISRWFWDLDHHGEIATRKKIPTLRTGLSYTLRYIHTYVYNVCIYIYTYICMY